MNYLTFNTEAAAETAQTLIYNEKIAQAGDYPRYIATTTCWAVPFQPIGEIFWAIPSPKINLPSGIPSHNVIESQSSWFPIEEY